MSLELWEQLREAGKDRKCLEIYYHSESSGARKRYVMIPWSFRSPNGNLTMYAWDVNESKMKQLRCDRIQLVTKLEQPWPNNLPNQFPMETSYAEIIPLEQVELQRMTDNKPQLK